MGATTVTQTFNFGRSMARFWIVFCWVFGGLFAIGTFVSGIIHWYTTKEIKSLAISPNQNQELGNLRFKKQITENLSYIFFYFTVLFGVMGYMFIQGEQFTIKSGTYFLFPLLLFNLFFPVLCVGFFVIIGYRLRAQVKNHKNPSQTNYEKQKYTADQNLTFKALFSLGVYIPFLLYLIFKSYPISF